MRITLIDDEWPNLDLLENLIGKIDSSIEIIGKFQNPLEAIPHVLAQSPDLIIIDVEMPFVNGVDMIRMLSHTGVGFIIVSANDTSDFVSRYALPRTFILTKPFTINELNAVINKYSRHLASNL
jgi:two-component SAPR family response regulator